MGAALKLIDETTTGEVLHEFTLQLVSERISARELVERRVRHEVEAHNEHEGENLFRGLVQPTDTEQALNGYRMRKPRRIDVEAQIARALEAFESNGFLMLVGDRQIESLDEEIVVSLDTTSVSFLKLVPLVGG